MSDLSRCEVEELIAHQGRHIDVARGLIDELTERVRLLESAAGEARWVVDWYHSGSGDLVRRVVCSCRAVARELLIEAESKQRPRDCDLQVICAHVVFGHWSDLPGGHYAVVGADVWRSDAVM